MWHSLSDDQSNKHIVDYSTKKIITKNEKETLHVIQLDL